MQLIKIDHIDLPELQVFSSLTESQLRNRLEPEKGIFIAESPKVIRIALQQGYQPISLLMEEKHLTGDAADFVASLPEETPIYTGTRELLAQLTGYKLTRGVLCALRRPTPAPLSQVLDGARRVVVIDGVVDTTNIGAIFRSAAALGIDGALLMPNACDPLNRRAVRVSMGTVFLLPWTWLNSYDELRALGFKTVAMALTDKSIQLTSPALKEEPRLAIIMGNEGDGLPAETISEADYTVRIPMVRGVDSLNVAAASAVAFWELCK